MCYLILSIAAKGLQEGRKNLLISADVAHLPSHSTFPLSQSGGYLLR